MISIVPVAADIESWMMPGFGGQPIIGDTHRPQKSARGVIVIAHGFKGYKDYGMFPRLAAECARAGFVAHRFNFSHSGMTNRIETFERPDLFDRDTWNKQVFDLCAVIGAMSQGAIAGQGRLYVVFGHSRGGVTALLTAGRSADDPTFAQPTGIITAAAPAMCNPLSDDESQLLLKQGFLESPSSRTGQKLRIGKAFLQEQLDDPAGHDMQAQVAKIRCPLLIIHGDADPTVDVSHARLIAEAAKSRAETNIIPGADHVFNTPNPMPPDQRPSPQLQTLIDAMLAFAWKSVRSTISHS